MRKWLPATHSAGRFQVMSVPGQAVPFEHADFVGRRIERQRLEEALGRVAAGGGVAVLISGETGIGKTALARVGLGLAAERGFRVLEGSSNPLNRDLAYGPIVEAVGRELREIDPTEQASLVDGLTALGRLFEGLGLSAPEPLGDAVLEKTRLFEAVLRLVDRMSRRAPVALLLDDLQWFDRASLELLAYMTRDLPGLPVLIIATYRSEDRDASYLRHLLQTLRKARVADEIELGALDDTEVVELAGRILGASAPPNLVDRLVVDSGGVPLFAEALIDALHTQGTLVEKDAGWMMTGDRSPSAPPVVREAIRQSSSRESGLVERTAVPVSRGA